MGSIPREADVTVSAYPGDPAPDDTGEFCECDDNDDPVNWRPTGKFQAPLSGDISGSKLNTDTSGSKTVTTNISYEYECSVTGQTKWEDEVGNPWNKTFIVEDYWIEGNQSVAKNEPASYEVKTNTGNSPNVTNWDASGGTISGSGVNVEVTWSNPGNAKQVTATVDQYGDVFTYTDVIGDLVVEIELPDSNPYVVAKDSEITFRAKDPEGGSGQYQYKWDFGKGNPTHGGVTQKEVSGVKFGADAEGEEHTVTLTLTDVGQANSGTATVNVIVPKIVEAPRNPQPKKLYYLGNPEHPVPSDLEWKDYNVQGISNLNPSSLSFKSEPPILMFVSESNVKETFSVRATASNADEPTKLFLKWNGVDVASTSVKIRTKGEIKPFHELDSYEYTDLIVYVGYNHWRGIQAVDNFDDPMSFVGINEELFYNDRIDNVENNWFSAYKVNANEILFAGGTITDRYGVHGGNLIPYPVDKDVFTNIAPNLVSSVSQKYRIGSSTTGEGLLFRKHKILYRRGYADQGNAEE